MFMNEGTYCMISDLAKPLVDISREAEKQRPTQTTSACTQSQSSKMTLYERKKINTPPEVEGAKAEVEPARAARTASFIMVSVVEGQQECIEFGMKCGGKRHIEEYQEQHP